MESLYYDLAPKDPIENLEWRIACRERALVDERFRSALLQACETDVLFFFAFALWVHEPRAKVKTKPFIPWKHQEAVILAMDEAITEAMATEHPVSVTLKKSRAQGGTYTYLGVQIRRALTDKGFSSGLVTRNEKTVDSKDPSAVMNKLSDMLDKLPVWMMDGKPYERNITDHTIRIPKTDAIWIGYSATADVARGGRTTLFAFDEVGSEEFIANGIDYRIMSSVAHVTNCIFLCSTFGADTGVFYESATDPDNTRVYALDWKENPEHAKLAYIKKDGVVTAINPDEQEQVEKYVSTHERELRAIERRGHKIEGKFRSPWYDSHCLLPGATPRYIARELDMDAKGSSGKVFSPDLLDRMKKNHGKKPVWRGTPIFDSETLELKGLVPRDDGPLSLWFKPGIDNSPPLGPFTIACARYATTETSSTETLRSSDRRKSLGRLVFLAGMPTKPICLSSSLWRWRRAITLQDRKKCSRSAVSTSGKMEGSSTRRRRTRVRPRRTTATERSLLLVLGWYFLVRIWILKLTAILKTDRFQSMVVFYGENVRSDE